MTEATKPILSSGVSMPGPLGRDRRAEVARLLDAMAEDTLELTDEEIADEVRAEGEDPKVVAERMRGSLAALVQRAGKIDGPVVL